jgi:hypothetical protein
MGIKAKLNKNERSLTFELTVIPQSGITNRREMLSTVDLLIKVACFVKKTMWSIVQRLLLQ